VHLIVSVLGITATFILDKREPVALVSALLPELTICTYSLLEAERGAGMSQRTRRPYLGTHVRCGYFAIESGRASKGDGGFRTDATERTRQASAAAGSN
jgi:hypothetical protein